MSIHLRIHLMTRNGMIRRELDLEVGDGIELEKLLSRLDKEGIAEKRFFRSVLRGKEGITLLLNGERLDLEEDRKRRIKNGDELAILSPLTGG